MSGLHFAKTRSRSVFSVIMFDWRFLELLLLLLTNFILLMLSDALNKR